MPFTSAELATRRPYAFHVCGGVNFQSIRSSRTLRSANALLAGTPHEHLLSGRRPKTERVSVAGIEIEVRDHRPLVEASLAFPANYGLRDFIAELNSRVFLWAGTEAGPVRSGRNHIARYCAEGTVYLLRVPTEALLNANPASMLEITFCNSGSARHNNGLRANRGPDTFVSPAAAQRPTSAVVELTFKREVVLPEQTMYAPNLQSQWLPL
jgi:hypothetical protein